MPPPVFENLIGAGLFAFLSVASLLRPSPFGWRHQDDILGIGLFIMFVGPLSDLRRGWPSSLEGGAAAPPRM